MNRIKIQSRMSIPIFILALIILFAIMVLMIAAISQTGDARDIYQRTSMIKFVIMFVFCAIGYFISHLSKDVYVSDIIIHEYFIELVYRKRSTLTLKSMISKDRIKSFKLTSYISNRGSNKAHVNVDSNIKIELADEDDINITQSSSSNLFRKGNYQFILDLIKNSANIPNFSHEIKCESDYVKEDIDYFIQYGKRLPLKNQLKYGFKIAEFFAKIILALCALVIMSGVLFNIYLIWPAQKLTAQETEFMQKCNEAHRLKYTANNTKKVIEKLEEAKEIMPRDPAIYIELAYNYYLIKESNKAIENAKEGLKYHKNKAVYDKYHNIKFPKDRAMTFYTILAQSLMQKKDYQGAIIAYDYMIENSNYPWKNTYFERGLAYYFSSDFEHARLDFIKHKEIVEKYLKYRQNNKYRNKSPIFTRKSLINIEKWINVCDFNLKNKPSAKTQKAKIE